MILKYFSHKLYSWTICAAKESIFYFKKDKFGETVSDSLFHPEDYPTLVVVLSRVFVVPYIFFICGYTICEAISESIKEDYNQFKESHK